MTQLRNQKAAPTSRLLKVDGFFPEAKRLRAHFDERFGDPRSASAGRFIWDWWNVPEQYTLLRTPAWEFFPRALYEKFHRHLVLWGRENLGCHDISPPWMSCYVDGCEQQLHADLPHGPWAFVFSLTPWKGRSFRGGETLLVRDPVLSYWENFETGRGLEREQVFESVPPLFNRLVVFDPRIPHGVKRVEGVRDVREGRLVIHGWFVQPRPFIRGPLPPRELQGAIDDLSEKLSVALSQGAPVNGVLSLRFEVGANGAAGRARALTNTLRSMDPSRVAALSRLISGHFSGRAFSRKRSGSVVTVPLIFET